MDKQHISVSQLTNTIQYLISEGIGSVSVSGEISNFKPATSGHRYFTLKDDFAQLSCVMWRSRTLGFIPKDGMKVIASGTITVYPPRGQYQLDCTSLEQIGVGDLYVAFEKLTAKLEAKGYFDSLHKKKIPEMPLKIGVITSPTGAAVRDIFSTLNRRFPLAEIVFRPTLVQGNEASEDIVRAIREVDASACDVIICGRGGGSIEDLWCFNSEALADAIYKCKTPIVSAVGHETDFTIADFVADMRAATPTAAAELVSAVTKDYLLKMISDNCNSIHNTVINRIDYFRSRIEHYNRRNILRRVDNSIGLKRQLIDDLKSSMQKAVNNRLTNTKANIESLTLQLKKTNPAKPLERGYAIVKMDGKVLNTNDLLKAGDMIEIRRLNETAEANVHTIKTLNPKLD